MRPFFARLCRCRDTGEAKAIQPLVCPAVSRPCPFSTAAFPASEQQFWEKQMAADWGSFVALNTEYFMEKGFIVLRWAEEPGRRFMARKRKPFPSCGSFSLVFSFARGSKH